MQASSDVNVGDVTVFLGAVVGGGVGELVVLAT